MCIRDRDRVELKQGDYVVITASPYSVPTVESSPSEFFESISKNLNWNDREEQMPFAHILSPKNQKKYNIDSSKYENDNISPFSESPFSESPFTSSDAEDEEKNSVAGTEMVVERTRQAYFAV